MKNKKTSAFTSSLVVPASEPLHDRIAGRAYDLWLKEGRPENRELDHWLEAERQLRRNPGLHDDAMRLSADPIDPASSEAAELEQELDQMVEQPVRRSATSTL